MGEKIEPNINHLDNTENEVIVMRPLGNRPNSKTSRYDWPLIRLVAVILVVGFIWYSRVQQNLEVEAANALADKKAQQVDVQSQKQKQREAYYQGMNERALTNQEQEAENARIAWQNYNEEQRRQKVTEISTIEQQRSNSAYSDEPTQHNNLAQTHRYWKCTDNTGVTTYSVEPCNGDAKQAPQNTERALIPTQKEIRIVDTQSVNVIHNPTPAPRVITKTVVVYRNASNQPSLNKMNSLVCQNAKRAYKFEKGSYFGKSFNRERIINDVWIQCGGWPSDLEG